MNNHEGELDRLLDNALVTYREAEPLAGMEDRVLQRMRLRGERRRAFWWQWKIATATLAVAALAFVVWIGKHNRVSRPVAQPHVAQENVAPLTPGPKAQKVQAGAARPLAGHPSGKKTASRSVAGYAGTAVVAEEHVPVSERFPTPAPLNRNERALLALSRTTPEVLRELPQSDEEISIAPITIKPLADAGSDDQGDN